MYIHKPLLSVFPSLSHHTYIQGRTSEPSWFYYTSHTATRLVAFLCWCGYLHDHCFYVSVFRQLSMFFFFGLKKSMQKSLFYFIRYIPHHRLHVIVYFVIPLPYQVQNSTRESQLCFIRKHYNCSKLPLNLLFGLFRFLLLLLHLHRIIEKKSELN